MENNINNYLIKEIEVANEAIIKQLKQIAQTAAKQLIVIYGK